MPAIRWLVLRLAVPAASLLAMATASPAASAATSGAAARQALPFAEFGLSGEHAQAAEDGDVVVLTGDPALPTELTGVALVHLAKPVGEVAGRLRQGLPVSADPWMRAMAEIDPGQPSRSLDALAFDDEDRAETARLAAVEPGLDFNLANAEIALIRSAAKEHAGSARRRGASLSGALRAVLLGRFQAYRDRGLDGLAAYDRADGRSWPGGELRRIDAAPHVPASLLPLARALDRFPQDQPRTLEHRFYWKKTLVNDRPAFILSHVAVEETPAGVVFALREFYVGHSYNVLQQIGLVAPAEGGCRVMLVNSTVTDHIAGTFGGLARMIGERRARDALRSYVLALRARLEATHAGR